MAMFDYRRVVVKYCDMNWWEKRNVNYHDNVEAIHHNRQ